MLYQVVEFNRAMVQPIRAVAGVGQLLLKSPVNPLRYTWMGRTAAAALDLFETTTRRYGKPAFGLTETKVAGRTCTVEDRVVWRKPFCELRHFARDPEVLKATGQDNNPRLLIVAPLSGHYATLLRGTVEAMLPSHEVYITDWVDARMVPVTEGRFDLDAYVDHVVEILRWMQTDDPNPHGADGVHVMAVCQPSVPVLAAIGVMSMANDPCVPRSMTLMGGPIDTRRNPTVPNRLAMAHPIEWFERHVIQTVPLPYPGVMRRVYPGFLQLTGFMTLNLERHIDAHRALFRHLVDGDGDSEAQHRAFYDEYLSVLDMTEEFYLDTVLRVFQTQELARKEWKHHGQLVDLGAIKKTALFTVEGEKDDISGIGQTQAAQDLCTSIPKAMRSHYVQPKVGHYGVFNGSRWRTQIQPRVATFIRTHQDPAVPAQTRRRPARAALNCA